MKKEDWIKKKMSPPVRAAIGRLGRASSSCLNAAGKQSFSSSSAAPSSSERRIRCTMIPGDGVGPEMMASVRDALKAIGAPVDFEVHHLSEVSAVGTEL